MHLAFIDITYDFTVDRPEDNAPLGGTTSALCFLARALQKVGVDCTIFNTIGAPAIAHGIRSLPLESLTAERHNPDYSAFVFCGRWADWLVQHIAEATPVPLIAWMHESRFGNALVSALPYFNGVVFVSDWQAQANQDALLPQQTSHVIRNAMGYDYETMFSPLGSITHHKKPQAVYIGSTPRGLAYLPTLWPKLHAAFPTLTLQIYSNPALISQDAAIGQSFTSQLMAMDGVTHIGMVGQRQLAATLAHASFYLAPNLYPETSCIALIEAMAAGLCCITTNRAALPETAHGFSTLVPITSSADVTRSLDDFDAEAFADCAIPLIQDRLADPMAWEQRLREQVNYFQDHYRWHDRATEWVAFIHGL